MKNQINNLNGSEPITTNEFFDQYIAKTGKIQQQVVELIRQMNEVSRGNRSCEIKGVPIVCTFTLEVLDNPWIVPDSKFQYDPNDTEFRSGIADAGHGYLGKTGRTFYLIANTRIKD